MESLEVKQPYLQNAVGYIFQSLRILLSFLILSTESDRRKADIVKISNKFFSKAGLFIDSLCKIGYLTHQMSWVMRNPVFGVSDQVKHKPGCTATEDGKKLEFQI